MVDEPIKRTFFYDSHSNLKTKLYIFVEADGE
jgi:hypothetical protein